VLAALCDIFECTPGGPGSNGEKAKCRSTVASGPASEVAPAARYCNNRLTDALHQQAFCAQTASSGARAHYDELCTRGTVHHAALRHLGNHLEGILHGCLKTRHDHTRAPQEQVSKPLKITACMLTKSGHWSRPIPPTRRSRM
jgi:hypothetical protein